MRKVMEQAEHPHPAQDMPQPKKIRISREEHEGLLEKARQLEDVRKELEELRDKYLRAAADFENAKKRLAREKEEHNRFAKERFVRSLLPILDNFERALPHIDPSQQGGAPGTLKDGIVLIQKQLADFLKACGVARLEAVGKPFDPHFHEAIAHAEAGGYPDQTVVEELEAGYLLDGRLLRPAKVRVSHSQSES